MSLSGHSRSMHSLPVPINVRCYSDSDMIVRRSEVTLSVQLQKSPASLDHFVGDGEQMGRNRKTERFRGLEVDN